MRSAFAELNTLAVLSLQPWRPAIYGAVAGAPVAAVRGNFPSLSRGAAMNTELLNTRGMTWRPGAVAVF